jgi:hypothetical protein
MFTSVAGRVLPAPLASVQALPPVDVGACLAKGITSHVQSMALNLPGSPALLIFFTPCGLPNEVACNVVFLAQDEHQPIPVNRGCL